MPTNITITSDDVAKSRVIGEVVAQALDDHGFTNVQCTHPPAFQEPFGVHGFKKSRSCLDQIRDTYPDFLQESVSIRAVPVIGYDKNGLPNYDVEGSVEREVAFLNTGVTGEGVTVVAFTEQGHKPPSSLNDVPNVQAVVKIAMDELLKDPTSSLDLSGAAWKLAEEGKMSRGDSLKVVDEIHAIEQQNSLKRAVDVIIDETGFTTRGISQETRELIRQKAEEKRKHEDQVRKNRAGIHIVPNNEEVTK